MAYWLVSQNESWSDERKLELLWSPKTGINGQRVRAYERLREVVPGDLIFNYSNGHVRAASRVVTTVRDADRPYKESIPGQIVDVSTTAFETPIPYSEIPLEMRSRMTGDGLPFVGGTGPKSGQVHQQYFAIVPPELGQWMLEKANLSSTSDETPDVKTSPPDYLPVPREDSKAWTTYRHEQKWLRDRLIGGRPEATCWYCGRSLPTSLVHLAHIKKRKLASLDERVDEYIGSLACTLGCDALFEHGMIIVSASGVIQSGLDTEATPDLVAAVLEVTGRAVLNFSPGNQRFYEFHRARFGSASS